MFHELTRNQRIIDIVLTCIVGIFAVGFHLLMVPLDAWQGYFSLLATLAAFWLRRRSPVLALSIVWLGVIVQLTSEAWMIPANLLIPFIIYATGRYEQGRVRWYGLGSAVLGGILAGAFTGWRGTLLGNEYPDLRWTAVFIIVSAIASTFLFVLSWTIGVLMRTGAHARDEGYRRIIAQNEQWAAQSEIAALEERNRIARDMHDVVAHSLAVIIAQSDGSRYAYRTDPEALASTLETVSATAREALGDVRLLLTELRHSQGEGPQPRLNDLAALFTQMRETGLNIEVSRVGTPRPLPAGQEMAVYRIIQESLTNALRHGDRALPVLVEIIWSAGGMDVHVRNTVSALPTPPPVPGAPTGHGLAGMRERASLAGGSVVIDRPVIAGRERFDVLARIPIAETTTGAVEIITGPSTVIAAERRID